MAGDYQFSILDGLSGESLPGGPFKVTVLPAEYFLPSSKAVFSTESSLDRIQAGQRIEVNFQLCDRWGNVIPSSGRSHLCFLNVTFSPNESNHPQHLQEYCHYCY